MSQSADNNHRSIPSVATRERLPSRRRRRFVPSWGGLWNAVRTVGSPQRLTDCLSRVDIGKRFVALAFIGCLSLGSLVAVTGVPLIPLSSVMSPKLVSAAEESFVQPVGGIRLHAPSFGVQQVSGSSSQTSTGRRALADFHREKTDTPEQLGSTPPVAAPSTMRIVPAPKVRLPQSLAGHAAFGAVDASTDDSASFGSAPQQQQTAAARNISQTQQSQSQSQSPVQQDLAAQNTRPANLPFHLFPGDHASHNEQLAGSSGNGSSGNGSSGNGSSGNSSSGNGSASGSILNFDAVNSEQPGSGQSAAAGMSEGPQIQSAQAVQRQVQQAQRNFAFPSRNGSSFTVPDTRAASPSGNSDDNASTIRLPGFPEDRLSDAQTEQPSSSGPLAVWRHSGVPSVDPRVADGTLQSPASFVPRVANPYSNVPLPGSGPYGHHFQDESHQLNGPQVNGPQVNGHQVNGHQLNGHQVNSTVDGSLVHSADVGAAVAEPSLQAPAFATPVSPSPAGHYGMSGYSVATGASPGTSGYRATVECDAPPLMSPYSARASAAAPQEQLDAGVPMLPPLPADFVPWWDTVVQQSVGMSDSAITVDVPALLQDAMRYSPQVMAIQTEPEVLYRVITQEAARFDWTAFLESKYNDLNDPVGNELTTGTGEDRLLTRKYEGAAGVRGRNLLGGEFRLAQEIGHENQNSRFFIPNNQGQTRLELSYRQPLLDGAGRTYNESEIILARIQANTSEDEVVRLLQDHLIQITEAYWMLYQARAEYFQRQKLLNSARQVLQRLEARTQVDTVPRQVLRARAAVARSQTRIQRTLARVRDAEAQLRLLVNSPSMLNGGPIELLPTEPPRLVTETADLQSVLQTSLINRPDISEAIRRMRASSVRLGVSRKELLPRLDLLVETYVADLSGNSNIGRALQGQFGDNRPGYTAGFEFEVPLENRAAIARHEQRQWELKRSINIFRATVEKSLTDVEIARREVATAWSEIHSHYYALQAANQEAAYLMDRFQVLPASEDSAVLLLQDLLDSQERVADEEVAFVHAQVDHAMALVKLKKETGILLQSRHTAPTVGAPDQQWLDERVQSATGHLPQQNPEGREGEVVPGFQPDGAQEPRAFQSSPPGTTLEMLPAENAPGGSFNTPAVIDAEVPAAPAVPAVPSVPGGNSGLPSLNGPSSGALPQPAQEPAAPAGSSAVKPYSRRISQVGFQTSSAAPQNRRPLTARDPLRGIPVAEHPTQWTRPAAPSTGTAGR